MYNLKNNLHTKNSEGFSLVEVILASSIFALLVTALLGAWMYGQEASLLAGNRAQAVLLAEEGIEVMRNIRDDDFVELTTGTYGLVIAQNQWNLTGSSDTTGIFTRQIEITSLDDNRREITSTVTWQQNPQREGVVTIATLLTNWKQEVVPAGPPDCTGPPWQRPPECEHPGGGSSQTGGSGTPDCTGPPAQRPPECN